MGTQFDKSDVLAFLRRVSIMSIAINAQPSPIASVVLFAIDDDFTMYFATHTSSYKAKALLQDNNISFSCWEHNTMLVQGTGSATSITDEIESKMTLDKLAGSSSSLQDFWPPVLRLGSDEYSVYRIKLNWLRVHSLTSNTINTKEVPTQEIEL